MNIAQALKEKNRLLKQFDKLRIQITENNRYRSDDITNRPSMQKLISEFTNLIEKISSLRQTIAVASGPIQEKIARVGLEQQYLALLTNLDTNQLPEQATVAFGQPSKEIPVVVNIDRAQKEEAMRLAQDHIDNLQDDIDNFNAVTQVTYQK
jgi:cell fate (sporulation/competence/biofilm development) regulator YmcA (YheA/YmcA/DUF963 family)